MSKKKELQLQQADIHLIVDLPMDMVLNHLYELDPENYNTSIKNVNSDEATFWVSTKRLNDLAEVHARGKVQRWKGTFSRLDADIRLANNEEMSFLKKSCFGLLLFALLVISFIFSFGLALILPLPFFIVTFLLGLVTLVGSVVLIIFLDIQKKSIQEKKSKHLNAYRALLKNLKNDLKDELKEKAKILSFDGTEDELTMILRQEEYKNFRLEADGEIGE